MTEQKEAEIEACMRIPAIISEYPDEKLRFRFCEISALWHDPKMIEQEPRDVERLQLCLDKLGLNETCKEKEKTFHVEGEIIDSHKEGESPTLEGSVHGIPEFVEQRVTPIEKRLNDLSHVVYEIAKILDVTTTKSAKKPYKPTLDVKNLRLRDFAPAPKSEDAKNEV